MEKKRPQPDTRQLQMEKPTGKGKHKVKEGNHPKSNIVSKPAIMRGAEYKCRILEMYFKLRRDQELKTILCVYMCVSVYIHTHKLLYIYIYIHTDTHRLVYIHLRVLYILYMYILYMCIMHILYTLLHQNLIRTINWKTTIDIPTKKKR